MAIANVQETSSTTDNSATASATFASNNTAANLVTVKGTIYNAGGPDLLAAGITDTRGNTYSIAFKTPTAADQIGFLAFAENCAAGANTITVAPTTTSANYIVLEIAEWSGLALSSALDSGVTNTTSGTSNSPSITAAGATAIADELVIALVAPGQSGVTDLSIDVPATTGYTNLHVEQNYNAHCGHASDYKILSATETPSAAWGTLSGSYAWAAGIAAFKAAASGVQATAFQPNAF